MHKRYTFRQYKNNNPNRGGEPENLTMHIPSLCFSQKWDSVCATYINLLILNHNFPGLGNFLFGKGSPVCLSNSSGVREAGR